MDASRIESDALSGRHRPIDRSKLILAAISGVLLTLAFPKTGLSVLAWIALVPLLLALRDVTPRSAFRLGLIFGLTHYLTLLYWIAYTLTTYGHLPMAVAVPLLFLLCCYMALYPAAAAWAVCRCCRHPLLLVAGLPTVWTALEFLRTFVFTGFPWGLLAYSQYRMLPVIQVADLTGAYGVSFLVVLVNAVLMTTILRRSGKTWQDRSVAKTDGLSAVAGTAAILVVTTVYGAWRIHDIDRAAAGAPSVRAAVVQGNIPQDRKWDPAFQIASTKTYTRHSIEVGKQRPDLVVWPETATPFYLFDNASLTRMVQRSVRTANAYFLIGSPAIAVGGDTQSFFNSAYLLKPNGEPAGRYDKAHLVPYGEYVPLRRFMPFVGKIVAQVGDFTAGRPGQVLNWSKTPLGPLICYEVIFPGLARQMVRNGAGLLANLTNDAWYGRTSAPYQHFSLAVFRSIENRRTLIRAANTGISGFIDPVGRPLETSTLFVEAAMVRELPVLSRRTVYTRLGDGFAWLCLLGSAVLLAGAVLHDRRKPD